MAKNGTRKYGRNKEICKSYRERGQTAKNKKRHLLRHLKHHYHDESAIKAFTALYAKPEDGIEALKAYNIQCVLG